MPKLKMHFDGQAIDRITGELVKWKKDGVIIGEFSGLLDGTYSRVKSITTDLKEMIRRPITRKRSTTRKK